MNKNNFNNYKYFLVVDVESGKPMAYDRGQFCYCTTEKWQDEHFPAKAYRYGEAVDLIRKTKRNRKRNGFEPGEYLLVPFQP